MMYACNGAEQREHKRPMCELCLPTMTRRRALGLAGAATAAALLGRPDPTAAARAFQTGYGVAVEPRSAWAGDSRPMLSTPPDETVRFLLVHHTAGPSEGDPIELMRQVYDFHTGADKGWPDVAYNFFVEPGGRVFEGRDGSLERAVEADATGGSQGFAQLVCLLGDFTNRQPTDAQLVSLNQTLAWLADRYGLDTSAGATSTFSSRGSNRWSAGTEVIADTISGHREMSSTACPGDTFYPYLKDRVQSEVHALRGNPSGPGSGSIGGASVSTTPPVPADSTPPSTARTPGPVPESPGVASTAAPRPSNTITLPATSAPPTTIPPTTIPATAASGPVLAAPSPQADELAVGAPDSATPGGDGQSANPAAWGLGAVAVAAVVASVGYLGRRGGGDSDPLPATGSPMADDHQLPPPSGRDRPST